MLIRYFVPVKEFANLGKGNRENGLYRAGDSGGISVPPLERADVRLPKLQPSVRAIYCDRRTCAESRRVAGRLSRGRKRMD